MPIRTIIEKEAPGYSLYVRKETKRGCPESLETAAAMAFLGLPRRRLDSYTGPGMELARVSSKFHSRRFTDEALLELARTLTNGEKPRNWRVRPGDRYLIASAEPEVFIFTYTRTLGDTRTTWQMFLREPVQS